MTPDQSSTVDASQADATAEAFAQAAESLAAEATQTQAEPEEKPDTLGLPDLKKLKAERDQYYEQWLRANAELDNSRKRMQREAEQAARYQDIPLIRNLMPAFDNLGRSIAAAEKDGNVENLLTGLRMVAKNVEEVFAKHSAKVIPTVGETFDPNMHDALMQVPTADHPPMTIIQEVERGYTLHERVIRPAKVIVATALPQ